MNHNEVRTSATALIEMLSSKILGQKAVIEQVVLTVLCGGHGLLTGSPGVAKTTLVRNLASALGCGYKRIQFTPDLTPFDILGGDTIEFDEHNPDLKRIAFQPGPIFAPFILADEINRASPRTQSALLEAMQERQVSIARTTRSLPKPFFVFATQNPIESEGTFPLPEAQLDRFFMNIEVLYPSLEAEIKVALLPQATTDLTPIENAHLVYNARTVVDTVQISSALLAGIVRIVRNTRPGDSNLAIAKNYLEFGASPRASQALVAGSRALALLNGQTEVTPEHVAEVAPAVLRHRCIANFRALSEKYTMTEIIKEIIAETVL